MTNEEFNERFQKWAEQKAQRVLKIDGYSLEHTGGNCTALVKKSGANHEFWITSDDESADAPETWDGGVCVGYWMCDADGAFTDDRPEDERTVHSVEELRAFEMEHVA